MRFLLLMVAIVCVPSVASAQQCLNCETVTSSSYYVSPPQQYQTQRVFTQTPLQQFSYGCSNTRQQIVSSYQVMAPQTFTATEQQEIQVPVTTKELRTIQVPVTKMEDRVVEVEVTKMERRTIDVTKTYAANVTMNYPQETVMVSYGAGFDIECATRAGQSLLTCMDNGGRRLRCLLGAGLEYLECTQARSLRGVDANGNQRFGFFKRWRAGRKVQRMNRRMAEQMVW